jgi:hypothetical protein
LLGRWLQRKESAPATLALSLLALLALGAAAQLCLVRMGRLGIGTRRRPTGCANKLIGDDGDDVSARS